MDASFTGAVFLGMSVDGFIARLDGDLSWLTGGERTATRDGAAPTPDDGEGGDFGFGEFVLGRRRACSWAGRRTRSSPPFDEWPYQGKPVHVLSTTLEPGADERITVHRLVRRGGRRAVGGRVPHGSTSTAAARCTSFLAAGLVGELTLSRVPVLIGTGHTPFGAVPGRHPARARPHPHVPRRHGAVDLPGARRLTLELGRPAGTSTGISGPRCAPCSSSRSSPDQNLPGSYQLRGRSPPSRPIAV